MALRRHAAALDGAADSVGLDCWAATNVLGQLGCSGQGFDCVLAHKLAVGVGQSAPAADADHLVACSPGLPQSSGLGHPEKRSPVEENSLPALVQVVAQARPPEGQRNQPRARRHGQGVRCRLPVGGQLPDVVGHDCRRLARLNCEVQLHLAKTRRRPCRHPAVVLGGAEDCLGCLSARGHPSKVRRGAFGWQDFEEPQPYRVILAANVRHRAHRLHEQRQRPLSALERGGQIERHTDAGQASVGERLGSVVDRARAERPALVR
mmetsp:Transcript_22580/g.85595  ORF Transcript_22580/g.85595 Transcript_22580/m.85595 type:complete len:264 (-) Transcript_22580:1194-1985(-)